jgi:NhaA family Na+:H+ antiporter
MFAEFVRTKVAGSVLLLLATIVALVAAKSSFREPYLHFWETELVLEVVGFEFHQTIHHLINDGLMALFFFVAGLEIKRELLVGQLSSVRGATLPILQQRVVCCCLPRSTRLYCVAGRAPMVGVRQWRQTSHLCWV